MGGGTPMMGCLNIFTMWLGNTSLSVMTWIPCVVALIAKSCDLVCEMYCYNDNE